MGNLAEVCSLDLGLNPRQGAAESLFGGGVDHFGLYTSMSWNAEGTERQDLTYPDGSIVGRPGEKADLGPIERRVNRLSQ